MLARLMRTRGGRIFIEFMRSSRGKKIDKFLVRRTGHSLLTTLFAAMAGFAPLPILLIFTKGRRTGQERSTVMPYFLVDGTIYLIGSAGGRQMDPDWVENLRVHSSARIIVDRKERHVTAQVLAEDDAERLLVWSIATARAPTYAEYQQKTTRKLPVVALRQRKSLSAAVNSTVGGTNSQANCANCR